jgi:hypothetical protein
MLALIVPISGGGLPGEVPTPPIHYPPSVWPPPSAGVPTPPIYYPPSPPPGIWPSPGHPAHPIAPGGPPPGVWPGPGVPTPPIYYPPAPPVGIWPSPPTMPPGVWPSPPVGIWPSPPGGGGVPPGIWPSPGVPTHPIYWPQPPPGGGEGETKPPGLENLPPIVIWVPGFGYITALPGVPEKPGPPEAQPK